MSDWRTLWKALRELGEYTIPGLDDEAYTSVGASGVLEYVFMAAKEGADLTDGAVQTRILLQGDSEWTGWNEVAQQLELISSGISVASDLYGFTDAEGRYAWDVPEGYWQVKYEKEARVQEEVKVGQEVDWDSMYQALPEEIKRTTVNRTETS